MTALLLPGFPIRRSAGQRLLAPHRSLSQLIASFFGWYGQGIRRTPLLTWLFFHVSRHPHGMSWWTRIQGSLRSLFKKRYFLTFLCSCQGTMIKKFGGDEENRTPVRKYCFTAFSECSLYFNFIKSSPIDRLQFYYLDKIP